MTNDGNDRWLVKEKQSLAKTGVVEVETAEVECGRTGYKATFTRLLFTNWVNVVALTNSGEIVLIKQYRFGTDRVELEIPGGAMEKGESPVKAGLRELLEETGYSGENGRVIGEVCPNPAIQNNRCYTVMVENAQRVADQCQDEMEDIEVMTISLAELDRLIENGMLDHGLVLNGISFLRRQLDKK